MKRLLRALGLAAAAATVGCASALAAPRAPEDAAVHLSDEALAMVAEAHRDIPAGMARDYHAHLLTLDPTGMRGYVNPRMLSWRHPVERARFGIYLRAAGIRRLDRADAQYVDRLVRLATHVPNHGKHFLLAFDQHYDRAGRVVPVKSEFHVSNEYVWEMSQRHPDVFLPAISVHPYRADALAELDRWGRRGVRLVKWLPNAHGIDASDPRLDAYYAKLREHDMVLLTHVGEEQAVEAEGDQDLGNPLRFRRPLDQGVRVIMAHAGSLGTDVDFEAPGQPRIESYRLVMRLLEDPRYDGLLFADISALTLANRSPGPTLAFLRNAAVHDQLVNGSDYPLPAVNLVIHLHALARAGLIERADVEPLREIYRCNPLLFDFVLKRRLRDPETGNRFPASVFLARDGLPA